MKIRISKFQFWTFFWFFVPLHILIISVPTVNLIMVMIKATSFNNVSFNIIGGAIYLILCLVAFIVLYSIYRIKNRMMIVLDKNHGRILDNKKEILCFNLYNLLVIPDYPDLYELIESPSGILQGQTKIMIVTNDGQEYSYIVGIMRITSKKIIKYINKYK